MKFLTLINGKEEMRDIPTPGAINVSAGDFKYHFTHYPGAKSVAEMQQLGWCVLDGTTSESQLVATNYFTLPQLAITGALDNLLTQDFSGRVKSLFVQSGNSGTITEDSLQGFSMRSTTAESGLNVQGGLASGPGSYGVGPNDMNTFTNSGYGIPRIGYITKPASIEAVPMMYCL